MAQKRRYYGGQFKFPDKLTSPNETLHCMKWNQQLDGIVCASRQLQQTSDCRNQRKCQYKDEKNALKIIADYYCTRLEAGNSIDSLYRLIPRCYIKYQRALLKDLQDIIDEGKLEDEKSNPLSKIRI